MLLCKFFTIDDSAQEIYQYCNCDYKDFYITHHSNIDGFIDKINIKKKEKSYIKELYFDYKILTGII